MQNPNVLPIVLGAGAGLLVLLIGLMIHREMRKNAVAAARRRRAAIASGAVVGGAVPSRSSAGATSGPADPSVPPMDTFDADCYLHCVEGAMGGAAAELGCQNLCGGRPAAGVDYHWYDTTKEYKLEGTYGQ
jgi:hypothetical protein